MSAIPNPSSGRASAPGHRRSARSVASGPALVGRAIAGIVVLIALLSCGGGEQKASETSAPVPDRPLRIALHGSPSTLDPHLQAETVAQTVLGNIYESLVAFDANLRLEPRLAETWDNPSDLIWRFQVRRGVRFHDGRELTLDDVIYSIERAMEHPGSRQSGSLVAVTEVRRTAPWTFELVTSQPYPILLNRLTFISIVPTNSPEEIAEPVGTGPYRFVSHHRDRLVLAAVDDHWRLQDLEPRAEYLFMDDPGTGVEMLLAGEVDLTSEVSVEDLGRIEAAEGLRVESLSSLAVTYFQMSPEVPPFDDPRVRSAVHLALDRQGIVESLHRGHAVPSGQMVSRNVFGFHPGLKPRERDLDGAQKALEAAGYPDGIDVSLGVRLGRKVEPLVRQLAEAGIRVTVDARPWDETYARLLEGREPFYLGTWVCTSGDAGDVLDRKLHTRDPERGYGDANHVGYSNPNLDALVERSNTLLDLEERQDLLQEALALALEDLVYVPILSKNEIFALGESLEWTPRQDSRVYVHEIRR